MATKTFKRALCQAIAFIASNVATEDLSRGYLLHGITLRLKGSIGATADMTAAEVKAGDEWAVVKRLDIETDFGTLISLTGEELRRMHYFLGYGGPFKSPAWAAQAAHVAAFDSTVFIPFSMLGMRNPYDTTLDTRILNTLRLSVLWGTAADVTSSAGAAFSVNPQLEVYSHESQPAVGVTSPAFSRIVRKHTEYATIPVGTDVAVKLEKDRIYGGLLIGVKDANGVDQTDSINSVRVFAGNTMLRDIPWRIIRDEQRALAEIAADIQAFSTNTKPEAWAFMDFTQDGLWSESIDTRGWSEFNLKLDVAVAIPKLIICPMQLELP